MVYFCSFVSLTEYKETEYIPVNYDAWSFKLNLEDRQKLFQNNDVN